MALGEVHLFIKIMCIKLCIKFNFKFIKKTLKQKNINNMTSFWPLQSFYDERPLARKSDAE